MNPNSVLIVDDNIDNLELAQMVLENEGFEVRVAEDAAQALKQIEAFHPKLVLMDVQLPGTDGLELTRRLRRDPSLDDMVIVALTAYAMKGDRENALAAGCDNYVTKPIDTRTFSATVRACLDIGRMGGSVNTSGISPACR